MTKLSRCILAAAITYLPAPAQQAVGLVFEASGAVIHRPGRDTPIEAQRGSELFAADTLDAGRGSARFSFCYGKSVQTLERGRTVTLDSSGLPDTPGLFTRRLPISICSLPAMERLPRAPTAPRRAAKPSGSFESRVAALTAAVRDDLRAALTPIDAAIKDRALDPNNDELGLAAARAYALEEHGLLEDGIAAYDAIARRWPEAVWADYAAARLVKEADQRAAKAIASRGFLQPPADEKGPFRPVKTYALLVGVSQYEVKADPDTGIPWLSFADRDARSFADYLRSERGGGLRLCTDVRPVDCEIKLLENSGATLAAVGNTFASFVGDERHAQPENALVIFIAAHGADPRMEEDWKTPKQNRKGPVILTYDSDYSDAKVTGYDMGQLRELIAEQGLRYGRVLVFVDVCRAGNIGPIAGSADLQPAVQQVFDLHEGNVGLFMASEAHTDAFEDIRFGDGHGAFTYAVLKNLNAPLPDVKNRPPESKILVFASLLDGLRGDVRKYTLDQQIPFGVAVRQGMAVVDDMTLPGMKPALPPARPILSKKTLRRPRGLMQSAPKTGGNAAAPKPPDEFFAALAASRLRRDDGPGSATEILGRMTPSLNRDAAGVYRERLRTALEDRGQQTILRYLRGDQTPQTRKEFETAAGDFQAAHDLEPSMIFDESRMLFCQGRARIFPDAANQKDYGQAATLLERAIRLDPDRAYAYNALGIAYLEQAASAAQYYDLAIAAFHDAISRAPYWTYPRHNLALALAERGDYAVAAATYQDAMRLARDYSYLPYNLGLLYQKMNRRVEAAGAYRKALEVARSWRTQGKKLLAPDGHRKDEAAAKNALGTLAAEAGKKRKAAQLYREAIDLDVNMVAARSNLALLAADRASGAAEAERLWKEAVALDPKHLPSHMGLAKLAAAAEQWKRAAAEWQAVLRAAPKFTAARIELAASYVADRQFEPAVTELRTAEDSAGGVSDLERIGDLYASAGDAAGARRAYAKAAAAAAKSGAARQTRELRKKSGGANPSELNP